MASQSEPDVVVLVRKLLASGRTFSISLEHPDSPAVKRARAEGHNFDVNLTFAQGDGDCIQWIEVPGTGLVCAKHKGD